MGRSSLVSGRHFISLFPCRLLRQRTTYVWYRSKSVAANPITCGWQAGEDSEDNQRIAASRGSRDAIPYIERHPGRSTYCRSSSAKATKSWEASVVNLHHPERYTERSNTAKHPDQSQRPKLQMKGDVLHLLYGNRTISIR
jgi:hypothetical protein